MSNDASKHLDG